MSKQELMHYGTKGMKWGVRKYQKKDGKLTSAGKNRYKDTADNTKKHKAAASKKSTAKKSASTKRKTKSPASVVASLGKVTVANAVRYKQNQHAYDAVGGMLSGDLGSMTYNALVSSGYGSLNRLLYD